MEEIWKYMPGFETKYAISNHGRVKSYINNPNGEIIKFGINSKGYYSRTIRDVNGKVMSIKLHRVVAKLFIPNPNKLETINHKDGDKLNNHVDNLEWLSIQDNIQHAINSNLRKRSHVQKLNENHVREIRNKYETTNISISQLARDYGVSLCAISHLLTYKTWFNVDPNLKYSFRINTMTKEEHTNWKHPIKTKLLKRITPKTPLGKMGISKDEIKPLALEFVNGCDSIHDFCKLKDLNLYQLNKYLLSMVELPIILNEGEIKFKYKKYILTTHGRVWSLKYKHRVNTYIIYGQRVASIIGTKFLEKHEDAKYIGFKDGDITNVHIDNLFWVCKKKIIEKKNKEVVIPEDTIESIKIDYIYGGLRYLDIIKKYGYTRHHLVKMFKGIKRKVKPKVNTNKVHYSNRHELTIDICEKIRHEFIYNNLTVNILCNKFSLSKSTIYEILNNVLFPSQNPISAILLKRNMRHSKKISKKF